MLCCYWWSGNGTWPSVCHADWDCFAWTTRLTLCIGINCCYVLSRCLIVDNASITFCLLLFANAAHTSPTLVGVGTLSTHLPKGLSLFLLPCKNTDLDYGVCVTLLSQWNAHLFIGWVNERQGVELLENKNGSLKLKEILTNSEHGFSSFI